MSDSIAAVSSSLSGLDDQYETITQNLANANTTGYKRQCTAFSQSLAAQMSQAPGGALTGAADNQQQGQISSSSAIDFTQGAFAQTGSPLDMAIDSNGSSKDGTGKSATGFFVIETPKGPLYPRNGTFKLDPSGKLVDWAGRGVAGDGGPIIVPSTSSALNVQVAADGEVFADGKTIGKLKIVQFNDESDLKKLSSVGGNCFSAPATVTPSPAKDFSVRQGVQESSNVNVVQELVSLITVTRLYEANLKNVQVQDDRLKNLLGVAMQ